MYYYNFSFLHFLQIYLSEKRNSNEIMYKMWKLGNDFHRIILFLISHLI